MKRRGRFAPTPSGLLHIGNALSALAAWLQIRQADGEFILRIEDIDKPRSRPAYAEQQQDDLLWLGIDWDEGPRAGGPHAPYEQSKREELYEDALQELLRKGRTYPCYCSRSELASIASAPHGLSSEGAAYPGFCRHLTDEERAEKEAKKTPALRFIMPPEPIEFLDGSSDSPIRYDGDALGDFVVKRADGMYSYQLAVTVDDAAMGITDVLRGADLLDSTPRQLALYEALGKQPPSFTHVPLVMSESGERLSKRDKSLTLASIRDGGAQPERLVGAIAYMAGWVDRLEPVASRELIPLYRTPRQSDGPFILTDRLLSWITES
ncbi:tRNA glutamyl-Q(34) synthetase GluQRS [Paenibacillus nanensis]|uniref:Glutamyl-Q tRNA(Asp) synthetase n=1 Tax=Paenibacillus nanensis TaxID=393251 RepID=A0A3A1UQ11_9BACL|nr:tRNA glutamyl-Q(34) synthetase GluQRS [Paenibacillus nanensis]RIX48616.1 tRNA glutamyl-Q(34) synthetase GluQRS [Paenibacillus nanensis]